MAGLWPEWSGISAPCSRMALATVLAWGTSGRVTRPRRASGPGPAVAGRPLRPPSRGRGRSRGAPSTACASSRPAPRGARLPPRPYALGPGEGRPPLSLDSLASADPAPPGCLAAGRVTRGRPSSRPASGGRPGTPLGSADEGSRAATPAASGSTWPPGRRRGARGGGGGRGGPPGGPAAGGPRPPPPAASGSPPCPASSRARPAT